MVRADFDIDEYCPEAMAEFLRRLWDGEAISPSYSKPGVTMSNSLVVNTLFRINVSLRKI